MMELLKREIRRNVGFGHTPFSREEVEDLFERDVEVIYIGTGQYGVLPVMGEAIELRRFLK